MRGWVSGRMLHDVCIAGLQVLGPWRLDVNGVELVLGLESNIGGRHAGRGGSLRVG
jgi:hypothetical protein